MAALTSHAAGGLGWRQMRNSVRYCLELLGDNDLQHAHFGMTISQHFEEIQKAIAAHITVAVHCPFDVVVNLSSERPKIDQGADQFRIWDLVQRDGIKVASDALEPVAIEMSMTGRYLTKRFTVPSEGTDEREHAAVAEVHNFKNRLDALPVPYEASSIMQRLGVFKLPLALTSGNCTRSVDSAERSDRLRPCSPVGFAQFGVQSRGYNSRYRKCSEHRVAHDPRFEIIEIDCHKRIYHSLHSEQVDRKTRLYTAP